MRTRRLLVILLTLFSGHIFAMSHTPDTYTAPAWSENANANHDAKFAIAHKDFRLLAYYTRGIMIPGIEQDKKDLLGQKCGLRILKGFGDVVRSQEQLKKMKALHNYVVEYNRIIAPQCLKQPSPGNEEDEHS